MIEIKVGEFLRGHIDKIIQLCKVNKEVFENLQNSEYCNKTFGLNSRYSVINKFSDIEKRGIYNRFYKDNHIINEEVYRVCSQFGGNHLIENINASVYHGQKLLNYFKEHNILNEEFKDKEINFIVGTLKENNDTSSTNINEKTSLNQILYGPPGTGKTYNTINRALEIIDGEVSENRSEAKARFEELSSAGQIEFVTFHQSYGYEEFVEGIKANTIDGNISYDVEDGIFKKLARKSEVNYLKSLSKPVTIDFNTIFKEIIIDMMSDKLKIEMSRTYFYITEINERTIFFEKANGGTAHSLSIKTLHKMYDSGENSIIKGGLSVYYEPLLKLLIESSRNYRVTKEDLKNHILIIDEINRGNISKIFGELITLIEPSKRIGADEEIRLRLPYSTDMFGVPSNLYIIGTMNTADRSIALMDTALRRRFEFVEMMPNAELLDFEVENVNLKALLLKINARVEYFYDRDHTIGHAYFMELDENSSIDELNAVMRNKIIPLLQEYFYDDWEKIRLVLNDGFVEKTELKADKIFDADIDDEYVEEEKFLYSMKTYFEKESYSKLCQNR